MASGNTLVVFTPQNNEPPASNNAFFSSRNGYLTLCFDATTDQSAIFRGFMPRHYAGGGVTVTVGWMAASATTNTVSLDVAFLSVTDDADDLDTKSFASPNNINISPASASGEVAYDTVTFTDGADMDSVAAGEMFFLKITRDADGTTSTDNMAGNFELMFIEIRET